MAQTVVSLEDLLALESRLTTFIDRRLRELAERPAQMFYTPSEVAEMVGLTVHAIRHRLRDPNEQHLKGVQSNGHGGSWLIPKESVDSWISSLKIDR